MIDIMVELKDAGDCFAAEDFSTGLNKIKDLWKRIPEPKAATANAYMVVEYAVAFALKMGDLDEAKKWADVAPIFIEKRQDSGEVEFLLGKVAYERGEIEVAKESIMIANKKSKGRILRGEDPKYKALIT